MSSSLHRRLLAWYAGARRPLPWRATSDPYAILLSEALCQQTRVEAALPYYERFLARWPTLADLARASEDDVLRAWAGLGYYSRARNLHRAARACLAEHGGRVPDGEDAFRALPGVGPYTAGAVLSIAFGRPLPAVDGNVLRVLSRLYAIDEPPARARREVERRAAALVPRDAPGDWNQALMELGARVCIPRAPRCEECPVAALCAARRDGTAASLPRRAERKPPPEVDVAVALVRRPADGALLVVKRPGRGLLAGMWAPPCVEGDGSPGALARALPVRVVRRRARARWMHKFSHRVWKCAAYDCELRSEIEGARWFGEEERKAIPTAFRPGLAM